MQKGKKLTEVETFLHPTDFFHYLKYIAKTEVADLFFKPTNQNKTLGQLVFGSTDQLGLLTVEDCGKGEEEEEARKLVLYLDNSSLPDEIVEEMEYMLFKALNKMAKRNVRYIVYISFLTN